MGYIAGEREREMLYIYIYIHIRNTYIEMIWYGGV